jgi:hypothetical protein
MYLYPFWIDSRRLDFRDQRTAGVREARHLDATVILSYRVRNEFNPKPTSLFNEERRESRARIHRLSSFPLSFCLKKHKVWRYFTTWPRIERGPASKLETHLWRRVRPMQRVCSAKCRYSRTEYMSLTLFNFCLLQDIYCSPVRLINVCSESKNTDILSTTTRPCDSPDLSRGPVCKAYQYLKGVVDSHFCATWPFSLGCPLDDNVWVCSEALHLQTVQSRCDGVYHSKIWIWGPALERSSAK